MIRLAICRGQFIERFGEGADRGQSTLLPECLDELVEESNSVRVIDCFVDSLDLADLGFEGVETAAPGRPAYHPSVLLKLYICDYLSRVQSSRRLEREAGRNLEAMWLLGRLVPNDKVIANFRKDNGRSAGCARASSISVARWVCRRRRVSRSMAASSKRSIIEIAILHGGRWIAGASSLRRVWRGICSSSIRWIGRNRPTCLCSRRHGARKSSTS